MTHFDRIGIVDWSGGGDRGPTPKPDAIWAATVPGGAPQYFRDRGAVEDWLASVIEAALADGKRLFLGFDFPFGYPEGFAARVAGSAGPLALWSAFAKRLGPESADRFHLAAELNAHFEGEGPFWFRPETVRAPGLSRTKPPPPHGVDEWRAAERRARATTGRRPFSCWQMGGAGAVGSQAITGIAALERLRRRFPNRIAVWPFEALDRPIAFVEVWPSLIGGAVAARLGEDRDLPRHRGAAIKDAAQVAVLAEAIANLSQDGRLEAILRDVPEIAQEEGWIFGLGHEDMLACAVRGTHGESAAGALPAGVDWTPVDAVLERLRGAVGRVVGTGTVPLAQASGRRLAKDVAARRSNPPAANAAVDGYALAEGVEEGAAVPLLPGRAAAGAPFDGSLPPGRALRILTGAPIPPGADRIVLQEDVRAGDGAIVAARAPAPGANIRAAGEDVGFGATVFRVGRRIGPPDLALLAAVGVAELTVAAPLRVGLLSTGDELVEAGAPLSPGGIADANRPMLAALMARWGHVPVDLGIARDDRRAIARALDRAAGETDAILVTGGASGGDEDHTTDLLESAGDPIAARVAIKPGRPMAVGRWRGRLMFALPGNPVAAFVCTLIFARPALEVLAGGAWIEPLGFAVPAAFEKRKKPGRREYLRARIDADGYAEAFGSEGSGRISGLSWADGLVELPDGAAHVRPGDPVRYLPFAAFGL